MDTEDQEHFRTIAGASVVRLNDKPRRESSSRPDLAYFQAKAHAICGCYRRDEAQDPETFAAALAIVLADYPKQIADYAADPRTGVVTKYPMGLPNIGQIKEFCDGVRTRVDRHENYGRRVEKQLVERDQWKNQPISDEMRAKGKAWLDRTDPIARQMVGADDAKPEADPLEALEAAEKHPLKPGYISASLLAALVAKRDCPE